jgi:hypothetical protein
MNENQKMILQMLAEGKISADDAARLLFLVTEYKDAGVDLVMAGRKCNG